MLATLDSLVKNPRIWQVALAGYWLAMFVGTHLPHDSPLVPGGGTDKYAHFLGFAGLAWLFAMTWERSAGRLNRRHLFVVWVVMLLYAALDEWTQSFVGRQTSLDDWLADGMGALAGLAVFAFFQGRVEEESESVDRAG